MQSRWRPTQNVGRMLLYIGEQRMSIGQQHAERYPVVSIYGPKRKVFVIVSDRRNIVHIVHCTLCIVRFSTAAGTRRAF
jgi:hypothetical protein